MAVVDVAVVEEEDVAEGDSHGIYLSAHFSV